MTTQTETIEEETEWLEESEIEYNTTEYTSRNKNTHLLIYYNYELKKKKSLSDLLNTLNALKSFNKTKHHLREDIFPMKSKLELIDYYLVCITSNMLLDSVEHGERPVVSADGYMRVVLGQQAGLPCAGVQHAHDVGAAALARRL